MEIYFAAFSALCSDLIKGIQFIRMFLRDFDAFLNAQMFVNVWMHSALAQLVEPHGHFSRRQRLMTTY